MHIHTVATHTYVGYMWLPKDGRLNLPTCCVACWLHKPLEDRLLNSVCFEPKETPKIFLGKFWPLRLHLRLYSSS
jgi:hypothetical protein